MNKKTGPSTSQKQNRKWLKITAGVLVSSGLLISILVPLLYADAPRSKTLSQAEMEQIINPQSKPDAIGKVQRFYRLTPKTEAQVNDMPENNATEKKLKRKYQSAVVLGKVIFASQKQQVTLQSVKATNFNWKQSLLTITSKNAARKPDANGVDQNRDSLAILFTFSKGQIIDVRNKLNQKLPFHQEVIAFSTTAYNLWLLLDEFRMEIPTANDFKGYNAFLDEDGVKGLAAFKKYLLTLGLDLATPDLGGAGFTLGAFDATTQTMSATLSFTHQGMTITKEVTGLTCDPKQYNLSWQDATQGKSADEVVIADIDASKLPRGVTIASITPSTTTDDGSTVTVTFSGGKLASQEHGGLVTYKGRAQSVIANDLTKMSSLSWGFSAQNKMLLPSYFSDKQRITATVSSLVARRFITNKRVAKKVQAVLLQSANIIFVANDETGVLRFQVALANVVSKTFAISGFITTAEHINIVNTEIDAEVAAKAKPVIKPAVSRKTGRKVLLSDLVITPRNANLKSQIVSINVKKGLISESLAGSIIVVTIEVSSPVSGTKTGTYVVDLPGFVSDFAYSDFALLVGTNKPDQPYVTASDFPIGNKATTLPSAFQNQKLVINSLFKKIEKMPISNDRKSNLQTVVATQMLITFLPNDETGVLTINVMLQDLKAAFVVAGFQTSS